MDREQARPVRLGIITILLSLISLSCLDTSTAIGTA
jgi:hypothetical protein